MLAEPHSKQGLPNRQYLRGREDTVRYIVTSLTDECCSELSEELMVATPLVLDDSHSDEDSMEHWDTWTPDPVHAHTCEHSCSTPGVLWN